MTSRLERRYRTLLSVLPGWYRADREEEMVGIFLADRVDELDLEYGWPGWAETFSTLGLSLRVRLGARALGDLVRVLALVGLVAGMAMLGGAVTMSLQAIVDGDPATVWSAGVLFELVSPVALALLLHGGRTVAKVVAGLALVPGVVTLVLEPNWTQVGFLVPWWVGFVLLCLGFHRDAATPAARPWWLGAGVAFVLGAVSVLAIGGLETYVVTVGLVCAVAIVLATRVWVPGFRRP